MDALTQRWQQLAEQFSALKRERRVLIALAVWIILTLPLLSYQVLPTWDMHEKNQQQWSSVEQQIEQQQGLIAELEKQLQVNVDKPLRQAIDRKEQRLASLKEVTAGYTLLNKRQRQAFLESALGYSDGMKLVSLASQSPEAISSEAGEVGLYRHQVDATYSGNYTELQRFFETLRDSHPNVQWHHFNYKVIDYPRAEVMLSWQLLSTDKEIIGG